MKFLYTPKQREVMEAIQQHISVCGVSPTLEEIGDELGIHRVTVHQHVLSLAEMGALRRAAYRSRSIVILDPDFTDEPRFTLGELLARLGFTTRPAAGQSRSHVLLRDQVVFTGDAEEIWVWLRERSAA